METAIPGTSVSVVNGPLPPPPTKIVIIDEGTRRVTGCCYHLGFVALLAGLILAIIAIVRDDLTKVTFDSSSNGSYYEYCGWKNMHGYDMSSAYLGTPYSFTYAKECGSSGDACTLQKIGTAWYALLVIGIVFAGLSVIFFIINRPLTWIIILALNIMFFACMLADVLVWGCYSTCQKACNSLSFPKLPSDITGCSSKFAISWVLVVIAGGLSLVSTKFIIISKLITNINAKQQPRY